MFTTTLYLMTLRRDGAICASFKLKYYSQTRTQRDVKQRTAVAGVMANHRTPRPGRGGNPRLAIPLFSKEASRLLSRGCVEANPCPWTDEEAPEGSTSPRRDQWGRGEGSYGQGDPSCLTCLVSFGSREEQVEHYRLDWHRYNIKRKLRGLEGVDQAHFERMEGEREGVGVARRGPRCG